MNTDKLAINWQNFAGVRLQLKFAFITRSMNCLHKSIYNRKYKSSLPRRQLIRFHIRGERRSNLYHQEIVWLRHYCLGSQAQLNLMIRRINWGGVNCKYFVLELFRLIKITKLMQIRCAETDKFKLKIS